MGPARSTVGMAASVVVCTFNRSALLEATVLALRSQTAGKDTYEILVVDNNSSDDTAAVTARLAAGPGAPVRYIVEKQQGLSHARNTGIRNATGDIVAFVDDDVDVDPNWLVALTSAFNDSRVMCAGGVLRPIWPKEKPAWLTKDWEGYLGITEFESVRDTNLFRAPTYPWGGNIGFRREIFDSVGLFPTNLGRIGAGLLSNEEVSVCRRIDEAGHLIRFVPEAIVFHKIHADRLTKQAFFHRAYHQGRSDAILDRRSGSAAHRRLRGMAIAALWARIDPQDTPFDRACKDRLFTGYLAELAGLYEGPQDASKFRRLRALKMAISSVLSTAAPLVIERQRYLDDAQAMVQERDEWISARDKQIAELTSDRDNWRRLAGERQETVSRLEGLAGEHRETVTRLEGLVRERDAWLVARDTAAADLAVDRDNWRSLAEQRDEELKWRDALAREREDSFNSLSRRVEELEANWRASERRAIEAERLVAVLRAARWVRLGQSLGVLDAIRTESK